MDEMKLEDLIKSVAEIIDVSDMDGSCAEEVLRILSAKTEDDRTREGILLVVEIGDDGKKCIYLDGMRGVRIKISEK